jgi:Protein of unknown function (DUF2568)
MLYGVAAAVAFLLELAGLASLAYWGAETGSGGWAVALAIVAPAAMAVVWGLVASPRARVQLAAAPKVAVRLVVLLGCALALGVAGQALLALVLALVIVADVAVLAAVGRPVAGG